MIRNLLIVAVLVAALAAGMLLSRTLSDDDPAAAVNRADVGTERMTFTLPDLEGRPRDFAEWAGKGRIVNFWATWCAPCRREIPLLKALQDEHGDAVQVIGIAVDFTEDVIAYAQEAEFNYPVLVGQEDAMAVAESSGVSFVGLPFTLVVTGSGELVGAHMGEIHKPQLDTIVAELGRLARGDTSIDAARKVLKEL